MFAVQQFWKDNFSGNKLSGSNLHYGYSLLIILMDKKGTPAKFRSLVATAPLGPS